MAGKSRRDKPAHDQHEERFDPICEARSLVAEFCGTFFLTAVAAGGEMVAAISDGKVSPAATAVAPGLVVLALIYAVSDVSGAHFNPAVTLAFALRRDFPWWRVPGYWLAQLCGAIVAALGLRTLLGTVEHLGASQPRAGTTTSLIVEIFLACLLVSVILGTAARTSKVGPNAALAVGSTIALCGLVAAPLSGASMNPARSLGPALVAGELTAAWIYVAGPALGSLVAVALAAILHTIGDPKEEEAASGEQQEQQARARVKSPQG